MISEQVLTHVWQYFPPRLLNEGLRRVKGLHDEQFHDLPAAAMAYTLCRVGQFYSMRCAAAGAGVVTARTEFLERLSGGE